MKDDRDLKSHVSWCWKQKRGIKLEQPNDNLCNVYVKKAKSSLNMLESATEKDEVDWISTTAYYARYFAFYALLQKCLFVENSLVEEHFYKELQLAKELRVDTQYYVTEEIDLDKLKKDSETARNFVLKMEEIIENLTEEQIKTIREKLKNARP